MRIGMNAALLLFAAGSVIAQAPAPAAGSGGGGPVRSNSNTTPTAPSGVAPPGTPSANTVPGQNARDRAGQAVIGHTATPQTAVPGNTGGKETGSK